MSNGIVSNLKEEREMVINEATKRALRSYVTEAIDKRREVQEKKLAEHKKKLLEINNKLDQHFERNHEPILKKHGFEKVHSANNVSTYVHRHDNGHVSMVSIHYTPRTHPIVMAGHRVEAVNTKGYSASAFHPNTGVYEPSDHDYMKSKMLPRFEEHIINVKENGSKDK